MKETLKFISTVVVLAFIIISICIAFISLIIFCVSKLPKSELPTESPDILKCRELGGMVIKNAWDGRLLDCKKL